MGWLDSICKCSHTYGLHFTTNDGYGHGCFAFVPDDDWGSDVRCSCSGFELKAPPTLRERVTDFLDDLGERVAYFTERHPKLRRFQPYLGRFIPSLRPGPPWLPTIWESHLSPLVDRSFEGDIQESGDTVNIPYIGDYQAFRVESFQPRLVEPGKAA